MEVVWWSTGREGRHWMWWRRMVVVVVVLVMVFGWFVLVGAMGSLFLL